MNWSLYSPMIELSGVLGNNYLL